MDTKVNYVSVHWCHSDDMGHCLIVVFYCILHGDGYRGELSECTLSVIVMTWGID